MGGNVYGVANTPPPISGYTVIGNVNISCPAGVETNFMQSTAIVTSDRGFYYILAWLTLCVQMPATAPTAMTIGLRVNNGADLATIAVNTTQLVSNTFPEFFWCATATPPQGTFYPPGGVVQLSLNPTGQGVTVIAYPSQGMLGILRLPP